MDRSIWGKRQNYKISRRLENLDELEYDNNFLDTITKGIIHEINN